MQTLEFDPTGRLWVACEWGAVYVNEEPTGIGRSACRPALATQSALHYSLRSDQPCYTIAGRRYAQASATSALFTVAGYRIFRSHGQSVVGMVLTSATDLRE
jgi:hypothetical protein